ncbi:HAD family hydrolase [Pseudomonas rustica]
MTVAVIFDLFGTLLEIRNRQNPYPQLLRLGYQQGRAASPHDIRWIMTHALGIESTAVEFGIKLLPSQLVHLQAALELELESIRLFDDALPTIELLREYGMSIGVCSNLSFPYCQAVRRLLPMIDAYGLSAEMGLMKPDPEIYHSVCRMLNVAPYELDGAGVERVVMIGDSRKCDQLGPRKAGIMGHHLDRSGEGRFNDLVEFARALTDSVSDRFHGN